MLGKIYKMKKEKRKEQKTLSGFYQHGIFNSSPQAEGNSFCFLP
jgi:hypothetical protein